MVKVWNIVAALQAGLRLSKEIYEKDWITMTCVIVEVFFAVLTYNAVLIMNKSMADPFGTDVSDFPMMKYQLGVEGDGKSYVQAGENLPSWIQGRLQSENSR